MSQLPPLPAGYRKRMPQVRESRQLVLAGKNLDGRDVRLTPPAALAWWKMRDAARADGVELVLVSGFRSVERQREIVAGKLKKGVPWAEVLRVSAYPGHSEHHSGNAVDIAAPGSAPLTGRFARSKQYRWLTARAAEFGFVLSYPEGNRHGILFEPWHWCHRWRRCRPS